MRLPTSTTTKIATKPYRSLKSRNIKASLRPPAMQSRALCASAPTTAAMSSAAMTGARMEPGPSVLDLNSVGTVSTSMSSPAIMTGRTPPSAFPTG